jgi:hypothetical protein
MDSNEMDNYIDGRSKVSKKIAKECYIRKDVPKSYSWVIILVYVIIFLLILTLAYFRIF